MKKLLLTSVGVVALAAPSAVYAQSTGSIDFENEIVVTGQAATDVNGVEIPDTAKAKQVLTQDYISKQQAGQSVLDTINAIPGVNFQNNDAYGSAGGTLNIRGFGGDRVSLTFDGVPLNDSGNYAVYSNQQLSPELIEQVNVNLGSTDVDSPTASATGGTVNYRTRKPYEDFSVRAAGTIGDQDYMRVFGSVDTGNLTDSGLRAFVAAEKVDYNWAYSAGKINKTQLNARVYQPLGDNGDFISISGHYNENRNHFGGSIALNTIVNGTGDIIMSKDGRYLTASAPCLAAAPVTGVADSATSCGNQFDRRFNPSNTGNVRLQSRFTLTDKLVLTIDPSFQFVKANGGSNGSGFERAAPTGGYIGQIGGSYYFGAVDLNGDGDFLDTVRTYNPNHTQTKRVGVISSLRYDLNETNTLRVSYTFDRARHRQTGEVGLLAQNGDALNPFPINEPLLDVNGNVMQRRDRLS